MILSNIMYNTLEQSPQLLGHFRPQGNWSTLPQVIECLDEGVSEGDQGRVVKQGVWRCEGRGRGEVRGERRGWREGMDGRDERETFHGFMETRGKK